LATVFHLAASAVSNGLESNLAGKQAGPPPPKWRGSWFPLPKRNC